MKTSTVRWCVLVLGLCGCGELPSGGPVKQPARVMQRASDGVVLETYEPGTRELVFPSPRAALIVTAQSPDSERLVAYGVDVDADRVVYALELSREQLAELMSEAARQLPTNGKDLFAIASGNAILINLPLPPPPPGPIGEELLTAVRDHARRITDALFP